MSVNEEILPALSRERECGWCCYSRGIASPLKSHLNKDLKGSFWLRAGGRGRSTQAYGVPQALLEFLEKPGGYVARAE